MLTAEPNSIFTSSFTVKEGPRRLAEVGMSWMREAGTFQLGGLTLKMGRDGWMSGDFYLEVAGERIASAEKCSAFQRRFQIDADGTTFELRAISVFSRAFELLQDGRRVGKLVPVSIWRRSLRADLPEALAPGVRVFITWLVLLMWNRARRNG